MAYVGNEKRLAVWNYLGQDESSLVDYCEQVAWDPDELTAVRTEIESTERSFAAAAKAEASATTTDTPAALPPASSYPRVAPRISLDCGDPVTGDWEWYRVDYGYGIEYLAPIVEFGMRYGDLTLNGLPERGDLVTE